MFCIGKVASDGGCEEEDRESSFVVRHNTVGGKSQPPSSGQCNHEHHFSFMDQMLYKLFYYIYPTYFLKHIPTLP